MSLRKHTVIPGIAEEKHNVSNVSINKSPFLFRVRTKQKKEKLEFNLCRRVHKRQRFILGVS